MLITTNKERIIENGFKEYKKSFFKRELTDNSLQDDFIGNPVYMTRVYLNQNNGKYKIIKTTTIKNAKRIIENGCE